MSNTAATFPTTGTTEFGGGLIGSWSNPTRVVANDNSYATWFILGPGNSRYLYAKTFNFAIPTGATIDGIVVNIGRKADTASAVKDYRVYIAKADGTFGTTNKADTSTFYGTSESEATYGSSTDLWGETWTAEDINDADFGAALSTTDTYFDGSTISVDYFTITIYYTEGAGPTFLSAWARNSNSVIKVM